MKIKILKFTAFALMPLAMVALSSCSSDKPAEGERTSTTAYQAGVPGGVRVDTIKVTAKVVEINLAKREMTIEAPDGVRTTVVASPDVTNFEQIQVGDRINAIVTQELVVHLRKPGARK